MLRLHCELHKKLSVYKSESENINAKYKWYISILLIGFKAKIQIQTNTVGWLQNAQVWPPDLAKYVHMGIWAYAKKIWPSGVSPKRALKMQLRDVDLRSVGPFVQKLWPTTFSAKKMPSILHYNAKKITNSSKSLQFWKTQLFSQKRHQRCR